MLRKDIRPEKNRLREEMKAFRREMSPTGKEKKDAAIRRGILSLKEYQNCDTLITFVSTAIEVDTKGLIEQALCDGKKVAVPYCVDGTRLMEFYYIRGLDDLSPRTFGVLEPDPARCEKLGKKLYFPPLSLCGDNAAMIAAQAYHEYNAGVRAGMELNAAASMPMDEVEWNFR